MPALCEPEIRVVDVALDEAEAGMVISSLDAGRSPAVERRAQDRREVRCTGEFRLFADGDGARGRVLYARDGDPHGLGFVCREQLPLGFRGTLWLSDVGNVELTAVATVYRCRPCAAGWYEGMLYFQRSQPRLCP